MQNFCSFSLQDITPENPLPGELYLFVSGHFLKYKSEGDVITKDKFDTFLMKGIQFVFVTTNQLDLFTKWAKENQETEKSELVKKVGAEHIELVEAHQEIKKDLISFLTNSEITDENIKKVLTKTRDLVTKVSAQKVVDSFMGKMINYNNTLVDHSANVANLSTYLALNIGYAQQILLENIYIGGLLHDFGKVKISSKYLDDPSSQAFTAAIAKHPLLGKTALLVDSNFPEEILRIVSEHHEQHDGKGYPKGIKGTKIYELTKIVSIANIFDNLVSKAHGPVEDRIRKALIVMEKEEGKMFDPKILVKSIKAIKQLSGIVG